MASVGGELAALLGFSGGLLGALKSMDGALTSLVGALAWVDGGLIRRDLCLTFGLAAPLLLLVF